MHSAVLLFLFCFFPSMRKTSFYNNYSQSQEKSHPEFGHFILNVLCDIFSDDRKIDLRLRIHPDLLQCRETLLRDEGLIASFHKKRTGMEGICSLKKTRVWSTIC